MFSSLSRLVTERPRAVLVATVLFLLVALALGRGAGERLGNGGTEDPASESARAAAALDAQFPASRPNMTVLVRGDAPADAPPTRRAGLALAARLAGEPGVAAVSSYWQTGAPGLRADDGESALIAVRLAGDETAQDDAFERIADGYGARQGDLDLAFGGRAAVRTELQSTVRADLLRAELIALPITLAILVVVFGSAIAALLPLAVGIVAIVGTTAVLRAITGFTDVSVFAMNLTTALGLGLAIDYGLLIVRRYREQLAGGAEPPQAIATTLSTAGRTVLFSAVTIAVALASMLVFPLYFLRSFAYAGVSVVVLAAAAALIALPALLAVLGPRVDALDVRRLWRRRRAAASPSAVAAGAGAPAPAAPAIAAPAIAAPAAATPAPAAPAAPPIEQSPWYRHAMRVMRRGPAVAVATAALLVVVGLPFLGVEFGTVDDRQLPAAAQPRLVAETLREQYGGGPGDALEAAVEVSGSGVTAADGAGATALAAYAARVSALPGVERVEAPGGTWEDGRRTAASPAPQRADGQTASVTIVPSVAVADSTASGQQLVRDVRAQEGDGVEAAVAGPAAQLADTRAAIGERLPWAIAIVALVTVVVVFLLTGSVLLPLQAVVANALSLTAMLGAIVWVFQEGNLSGLLGFTATGSIETALPVLMFCVAFGLSMDYGIFLLARAKEERDRTGGDRVAVATALARTGGVVTAAAAILAIVFVAIGTSQIMNMKMMGLGIALAVLVDATIVRALLVPAMMAAGGRWTWWAPRPLRRLHARVGLRESDPAPA
jgi:RND superfamily putative drug exporter